MEMFVKALGIEMTTETHPLLFDHVGNFLHGCVPIVTSKIIKNSKSGDLSTSLGCEKADNVSVMQIVNMWPILSRLKFSKAA